MFSYKTCNPQKFKSPTRLAVWESKFEGGHFQVSRSPAGDHLHLVGVVVTQAVLMHLLWVEVHQTSRRWRPAKKKTSNFFRVSFSFWMDIKKVWRWWPCLPIFGLLLWVYQLFGYGLWYTYDKHCEKWSKQTVKLINHLETWWKQLDFRKKLWLGGRLTTHPLPETVANEGFYKMGQKTSYLGKLLYFLNLNKEDFGGDSFLKHHLGWPRPRSL